MELGKRNWETFERGIEKEWLLTNGIGGYSSSTIIGANARRYHGLLIASLEPPVERHLIISKLDESIIINQTKYDLYSNKTPDYCSKGYLYLQRFTKQPLPTYIYSIEDVFIEKVIAMVYGKNEIIVTYKIITAENKCTLKIAPLINFRNHHYNSRKEDLKFSQSLIKAGAILSPNMHTDNNIFITINEGKYTKTDNLYFNNMYYSIEAERGLDPIEDHFIPGIFDIDIGPNQTKYITITAGIGKAKQLDGNKIIKAETERIGLLVKKSEYKDKFAQDLVKSCDNFIVHRNSTNAKTVIAGYPWFNDWGRDAMISLPGLTLSTKRYNDAREILSTFAKYLEKGLIPNVFLDTLSKPAYNTVDAALWYVNAVYKYIQYTNDYNFIIKENIYKAIKEIIKNYIYGSLNNIKMQSDGLIYAGSPDTQLTWMDVKIGDWVVTPRYGKAVEINALWYNALMIISHIEEKMSYDNHEYIKLANLVKKSFIKEFWNEKEAYLYDIINENGKNNSIRPNQIFAVSLDFPTIKGDYAKKIVNTVFRHLYMTYGLRSLSCEDSKYMGIYIGNQFERDSSYHQGTGWSWLIGPFITAYRKAYNYSEDSRRQCLNFIAPFKSHINDACIGSISEIFDGNSPNYPRGCFAQAWGVAELLRAYTEDIIN